MDEQILSELQDISGKLFSIDMTLDEIAKALGNTGPLSKLVDRLDDIAEGIGDINSKMGGSSRLHETLDQILTTVRELPEDISSYMS